MRPTFPCIFHVFVVFFFAAALLLSAGAAPLKIMPVGDSITAGQGDSQGYGYRDNLATKLTDAGLDFQYVGNSDPQYPGWFRDGAKIDDFNQGGEHDMAAALRDYTPNILLMHLGTNDLNSSDPTTVKEKIENLLQYLSGLPEWDEVQRVLLCKIIPRKSDNVWDQNVAELNSELEQMVADRPDDGVDWSKVELVDMYSAIDPEADMPPEDEGHPGRDLHPNASGYEKMATQFARALDSVTDDFERADGPLGDNWSANPDLVIQNGRLHNQSSTDSWNFAAVYTALANPQQVSIELAADASDADRMAILFLNGNDYATADGYFVYYRIDSNGNKIRLYRWSDQQPIKKLDEKSAQSPPPAAGSVLKVSFDSANHTFQVYVDNVYAGELTGDAGYDMTQYFGGVCLRGGGYANDIESFTVNSSPENDTTPPAAVDDLTWTDKTTTSVTLQWTATANDGNDAASGSASQYDLRRSTSPIDEGNFNDATPLSGALTPSAPGTLESFEVNGLAPGTEYWFALKVKDAAGNTSLLSNVISVTTDTQSDTLIPTCDDFDRDQLGKSDWDAAPEQYIDSGDLAVQNGTSGWNYLAVYRKPGVAENPRQVAITFSPKKSKSSQYGFLTAGIAVLLDDTTSFANGYFIVRRTNELQLWRITNGNKAGDTPVISRAGLTLAAPAPGDELKTAISELSAGQYQFDVYINNQYDATIDLQDTQYTPPDTWYTGIMQFGGDDNQIDEFCVYQPRSTQMQPYAIEEYHTPNPASGPIQQRLADSLAVRVTNESRAPVPDAVVNFAVQQGQADLSVNDQDFDIIWKEVESGTLEWPMQTESDASASGGRYAVVPSSIDNSNGQGKSTMTIWLPRKANCSVYARYIAPSNDENSFFYRVDDDDSSYIRLNLSTEWRWKLLGQRTFSAGLHKIVFRNRESGTKIDKIAIVDSDSLPQYKDDEYKFNSDFQIGGSGPRFTNVTDSLGIAYTFVTFWTDADTNVIVQASGEKADGTPLEGSPVLFELDPTPFPAKTLTSLPFPPDTLLGSYGLTLSDSFVVVARDTFANAVPGVPIAWQIVEGTGGELTYEESVTDGEGKARCLLKMGADNFYKVSATSNQLPGQQAEFYARVSKLPGRMEMVKGPSGEHPTGTALSDTCVVRVFDKDGAPYPSFPVDFIADEGSGVVRPAKEISGEWKQNVRIYTDSSGYARALWKLGCEVGSQHLQAHASVPQGSPAIFQVQATTGQPAKMEYASQDSTSGPLGMDVDPFIVQVTDSCGNPVPDVIVEFQIMQGTNAYLNNVPGQIAAKDTTAEDGKARVILTLGLTDGEVNVVRATASDLPLDTLEFKALSSGIPPAKLVYVSGDDQDTTVTHVLADSFKVRVLDIYGHGYPDHDVTFILKNPETGGVFVNNQQSEYTAKTNQRGYATALLHLGTRAGIYAVDAISKGKYRPDQDLEGSPFHFVATALPDSAYNLSKVDSTDRQKAQVDTLLDDSLQVVIKDRFGNPVLDHPVEFTVVGSGGTLYDRSGSGTTRSVKTNQDGVASVAWKMPTKKGLWQVRVASQGVQGLMSQTFTATALSGPAYTMKAVQDTLNGQVNQPLPDSVRVRVLDQFGNPVSGQSVSFQITQSRNGTLNQGTSLVRRNTNDSGQAAVRWTLGTHAGIQWLKVSSDVIDENSRNLMIYAVARHIDPVRMVVDDRSRSQVDTVGQVLDNPIRVQTQDDFQNGVPGVPVFFRVIKGGGKVSANAVDFSDTLVVFTDDSGWAQVLWQIGGVVGSQKHALFVRARYNSADLDNSPDTLYASAFTGPPDSLLYATNDTLRGKAGSRIPEPPGVKVVDSFDNAIERYPVTFKAIRTGAGVGYFNNDPSQQEITVYTNDMGIAAPVQFTLGKNSGAYLVKAYANYKGENINGSPRTFTIFADPSSADSIAISGNSTFADTVGKWIETPLEVIALDSLGNPVQDHQPITFTIRKGRGHLGGSRRVDSTAVTDTTVYTNEQGIAQIYWQLGTKIGPADSNLVEAKATNSRGSLKGSPLIFKAQALADLPDPDSSSVQAFPPPNLKANGVDSTIIVVRMRDRYNNPVKDVSVQLQEKPGDLLVDVSNPPNTDINGETQGFVKSGRAGWIRIYARDVDHQIEIHNPARVYFKPGEVSNLSIVDGANLRGNIGTILKNPLQVKVSDANGNGVPNTPVTFKVSSGKGKLYDDGALKDSLTVRSDSSGIAAAGFVLGTDGPENYIDITTVKNLQATIHVRGNEHPTPFSLQVVNGQYLSAAPGDTLPERICVKVVDRDSLPIWGEKLCFKVLTNDGRVDPDTVMTDMFGSACTKAWVGSVVGLNTFRVSLVGHPGIVVDVVDTTGSPQQADLVVPWEGTPAQQSGTVGRTLSNSFYAQAVDRFKNIVYNVPITFLLDPNTNAFLNDSLKATTISTGNLGYASITLTLDTLAGPNVIYAAAPGTDTTALFTGYGLPDKPAKMVKPSSGSGDEQTYEMGRLLPYPIVALVQDKYGNPTPGGSVTFTIKDGGGSLYQDNSTMPLTRITVASDSNGRAKVRWQLGPGQDNRLRASSVFANQTPIYYTAYGDENHYPEFDAPEEIVAHTDFRVSEGYLLSFIVHATDGDGDSVTYKALRLPDGAVFDAAGTHRFSWTPSYAQGGHPDSLYFAVFEATDEPKSGWVRDSVKIHVRNASAPISLISIKPENQWEQLNIATSDTVDFCVQLSNPENLSLQFRWLLRNDDTGENIMTITQEPCYKLQGSRVPEGFYHLTFQALVSHAVQFTFTWAMRLKVPVELSLFRCHVRPYEGVTLEWATAVEAGNLGFNVLRSQTKDGVYEKINTQLIPSRTDRKYQFVDNDVKAGLHYFYKIEDVSKFGLKTQHGPVVAEVTVPKKFDLAQNYPNPFNPATTIRYQLPRTVRVRLDIFNIMGQVVCTLVDEKREPGYHLVVWDGRNNAGNRVGSGVYYYRLQAGDYVAIKKMALLK